MNRNTGFVLKLEINLFLSKIGLISQSDINSNRIFLKLNNQGYFIIREFNYKNIQGSGSFVGVVSSTVVEVLLVVVFLVVVLGVGFVVLFLF